MTIYQFAVIGAAVGMILCTCTFIACIIAKTNCTWNLLALMGWGLGFGTIGAFLGWVWNI